MLHLCAVLMLWGTPSEALAGGFQNKHPQQRLPVTDVTNMPLLEPSRVSCGGLAHLEGMLSRDGPGSVAIVVDAVAQGLHARDEGREGQPGV